MTTEIYHISDNFRNQIRCHESQVALKASEIVSLSLLQLKLLVRILELVFCCLAHLILTRSVLGKLYT